VVEHLPRHEFEPQYYHQKKKKRKRAKHWWLTLVILAIGGRDQEDLGFKSTQANSS
jgi:hypothetical protein